MKKLSALLLLLILVRVTNAQTQEKKFTLYFDTDSEVLDKPSKNKLDSVKAFIETVGHYELFLHAHTDQVGSALYNQALSRKREQSTLNYLIQKGVSNTAITCLHHGEAQPALRAPGREEIRENRRVEVLIRYRNFIDGKEILEMSREGDKQQIPLLREGAQEIVGEKGIRLLIPDHAFMKPNGDFVSNESVVIELAEFSGFSQAIEHGLGTMSHGALLESGGMFSILAKAGEEPLELREGIEIGVQLPSTNLQPGMTVFYGERNAQGIVDWENSGQAFNQTDTSRRAKLPLPGFAEELLSMRKSLPNRNDYDLADLALRIPTRPNMPFTPRKPQPPVEPQRPEHVKEGVFAFLNSEWREWNKAYETYQKQMKLYDKRMDQYGRRIEIYHKRMEKFRGDSIIYGKEMQLFHQAITAAIEEREHLFESLTAWLEVKQWNHGLEKVAALMRDSNYFHSNLYRDIMDYSLQFSHHPYSHKTYQLTQEIQALTYLKRCDEKEALNIADKKRVFQFSIFFRKNMRNELTGSMFTKKINRCYVKDGANPDPNFARVKEMEAVIANKKSELGIFERNDLPSVYSTRINKMGFINCDRFSNTPPRLMADIKIDGIRPGDQVFLCVHRLNSILPIYSGQNGVGTARLPIGEKVTLVSIGAENGFALMAVHQFRMNREIWRVEIDPKQVTLEMIKSQLAKL